MRILSVIHNLESGGTQRAAINHTVGYARAGAESALLAFDKAGPREADLEGATAFIQREGEPEDTALQQAAAWKPDAVHIHRTGHTNHRTASVLRVLRDAGARAVIETNHVARADTSPDRLLIDVHLQLSRWCLVQWQGRNARLSPRPIGVVVPHIIRHDRFTAITPEARAAWRAAHGIPNTAVVFGRIARPSMAKWTPLLLNAFAEVARTHPDAWLLTVGLPPQLEKARAALPPQIRDRTTSLPVTNDDAELARAYAAMDVLAHHAKRGETFGMVLCEAALCGTPAITVSQPLRDNSQVELLAHNERGLVAGSPRAFADAMRRMADDADLRHRLMINARDWTLEHCDIDAVTATIMNLFRVILDAEGDRDAMVRAIHEGPFISRATPADVLADLANVAGATPRSLDRLRLALSSSRTLTDCRQLLQKIRG